jgi:hypothetical protein
MGCLATGHLPDVVGGGVEETAPVALQHITMPKTAGVAILQMNQNR